MTVDDKIIEIIAEQAILEPSDLSLETKIEELGMDSLGLVEAVFAIEEEYNISVPFNANDPSQSEFDITSVGSIAQAVKAMIKEQSG